MTAMGFSLLTREGFKQLPGRISMNPHSRSARLVSAVGVLILHAAILYAVLALPRNSLLVQKGIGQSVAGSEITLSLFKASQTAPSAASGSTSQNANAAAESRLPRPRSRSKAVARQAPSIEPSSSAAISSEPSVQSAESSQAFASSSASAGIASDFQQRLLAHIATFKRYPNEAPPDQRRVELTFAMTRDGLVLGVWITRSSGYTALDKEAIATVLRSQPLPSIPDELPAPLNITLPVDFDPRS
jgi:periplasmic protein TonB